MSVPTRLPPTIGLQEGNSLRLPPRESLPSVRLRHDLAYHECVTASSSLQVFELQTTTDEAESCYQIRDRLVSSGLTPCVKIQPGCESTYYWHSAWQTSQEFVITTLTCETHVDQLASIIRSAHNYENPEIIARQLSILSKDYADWLTTTLMELQGSHNDS
jgi:periplasmic divalent cation tolerance protein